MRRSAVGRSIPEHAVSCAVPEGCGKCQSRPVQHANKSCRVEQRSAVGQGPFNGPLLNLLPGCITPGLFQQNQRYTSSLVPHELLLIQRSPTVPAAPHVRTPKRMKTICSWCARMGRVKRPAGLVSDGICQEHAREFLASYGIAIKRCDGVARPVPIQAAVERKEAA